MSHQRRRGRLARRVLVGLVATVAGFVAIEQAVVHPPLPRATEVAGASYTRGGLGYSALGDLSPSTTAGVPAPGDVAIAPPPESFGAPAPKPVPVPAALRAPRAGVTPQGGTWSVVIGINDYPGSRYDLRSAVADAADMSAALQRLGVPADHILYLQDRQATAGAIRSSIEWLTARAGPDAVATIFYAGHVRKISSGREAIVGSDGNLVTDIDVAARLTRLQAKRAWIALAACYAGGFTEVLGPGRVLTAAAGANDLAYENDSFGRSYLVEFMVRRAMLQGFADRDVETSFGWARTEIEQDYPNRVPVQYDQLEGNLDVRPPGAVVAPASGRASAPSSSGSTSNGSSGGGSGGSQPPPQPTTTTTAPPRDGCSNVTLGIVRCSG